MDRRFAARRGSTLDRLLGVFAEVRPGEGLGALLLALNGFLILCASYILKPVREGLILTGGMLGLAGDELKIYASAAQAVLLVAVIPAYGALANRMSRLRLLSVSVIFFICCLAGFFLLARLDLPLGLAFFLWLGIFNMLVVAQFWSYANDLYRKGQGERLFPIVAIGGSLGAIAGPAIAGAGREHPFELMLVAATVLAAVLAIYGVIERAVGRAPGGSGDRGEQPLGKEGGFQLILRERYLLYIALMLLVANLVNTTGEYILANRVRAHAAELALIGLPAQLDGPARAAAQATAERALITGFYGDFYGAVNLVSFLVQAFLVSRLLKRVGLRVALFILPVIALAGYALIGLVTGIAVIRLAKIAENATDYSLQNTVRQALFLPTSRDVKYKAKAAIDVFFVRFGDALSAGLVVIGVHFLDLSVGAFCAVNVALAGLWIAIAVGIARRHRSLTAERASGTAGPEQRG